MRSLASLHGHFFLRRFRLSRRSFGVPLLGLPIRITSPSVITARPVPTGSAYGRARHADQGST